MCNYIESHTSPMHVVVSAIMVVGFSDRGDHPITRDRPIVLLCFHRHREPDIFPFHDQIGGAVACLVKRNGELLHGL